MIAGLMIFWGLRVRSWWSAVVGLRCICCHGLRCVTRRRLFRASLTRSKSHEGKDEIAESWKR